MCRTLTLIVGALVVTQPVQADRAELEELVVIGEKYSRTYELADTVDIAPDSATLLRKAVGANIVSNGPLTGIAQIRGMSRYRINTQINGAVISAGGPNWMDPPLSYAPAAHLESLEVYRGIAPVGAGQESIGGVINAKTWDGEFGDGALKLAGRARTGAHSVDNGTVLGAAVSLGGEHHKLRLSGLTESADDAEFQGGKLLPTRYQRDRFDVGYGFRMGAHTLQLDYGRSETGNSGTPALPMDIQYIDANLARIGWTYASEAVEVQAKLHYSDIGHGMTNYHLRQAPMAEGMWRRNIAVGESLGFAVSARMGGWTVGVDGHDEVHDSDIDNPNNPMFFVRNFNHAERTVLGIFVEREQRFGDGWMAQLGVRYNNVSMDSDSVDATPAAMGMPPAVALRDRFNGADRSSTDHNFDWVVKVTYQTSMELAYYAGLSRKSRSPSYQERFLWLPMQATAGLADGLTYTGNLGLDPEVAHEVELGLDWEREGLLLAPRIFYRGVNDYIQGTASADMPALMFVQMMNAMNGAANPLPLQFNNVDAKLYGFDVDWAYELNERWSLNGVVNYVRGKRDDVDDNLYRVAPLNAFVALNYTVGRWGVTLESFWNDAQRKVSDTNGELRSSSYELFNLHGFWQISGNVRLGFGVNNLADKRYADHLGGVNRVRGNADLPVGERLPGYGRSAFARLDVEW
ncbi:MAG: TonB-dependent receptor [Gammaproteobacteria bacterium]|nr:TonB-dependent receptor [Gammaproteobacteria bacterium]